MTKRRIPLYDIKLSRASRGEVNRVLSSGWLTTGSRAAELEKQISTLTGSKYAAALSSATAGLQLTLESIGVGPGREVITTPYTFVATLEAILHNGATPVLVDIEPNSLTIDPIQVEKKISKRTACILPVDIAGHPANYPALRTLARKHRIPVVADASHSLGAEVKGKPVAAWVDAAIYSLQATKNLTTAEGGIVVSNRRRLIDRVRRQSLHAMSKNAYRRRAEGKWEYDIVDLGHKANLSDIHAALGIGELIDFEKKQTKRRQLAAKYLRKLEHLEDWVELPTTAATVTHAWHLFIVRLKLNRLKISRNEFITRMSAAGIECGVHYKPIYDMSYYRQLGYSGRHLPESRRAGQRVVTLPFYPHLKADQVDYISEQMTRIFRQTKR